MLSSTGDTKMETIITNIANALVSIPNLNHNHLLTANY